MILSSPRSFFASRNTVSGFHSDFQTIFSPTDLNQIYIMKGGPGTGKSSFMRDIANFAKEHGITVEYFFCSSDPKSLDGIILKEPKIAIIDGTSPHTTDPNFPGVVENIINLGNFWDINKLAENKTEIIGLIKEKTKFYKRAYQFLSAYGEIAREIFSMSKSNLNCKKMMENLARQSEKVFTKNASGKISYRNIATFSAEGLVKSDSFLYLSKTIYIVEDYLFSGYIYLKALEELSEQKKQNVVISRSPILTEYPNALYFPDTKCAFVIGERDYDTELPQIEYHYVNMKRFLNMEKIKENKQKNKFGYKCMAMLLDGATESFDEAKRIHKNLESYYISAMDFDRLEEIKNLVKSSILDKL